MVQRFVAPAFKPAFRKLKEFLGEEGYDIYPVEGKHRGSPFDLVASRKTGWGTASRPTLLLKYKKDKKHRWRFDIYYEGPRSGIERMQKHIQDRKHVYGKNIWQHKDIQTVENWWHSYISPATRKKMGVA